MNTLAYRRTGTPGDTPLVLLHALPLDSSMWDGVRAALPDLDIITPDSPGFGASPQGSAFGEPNLSTYATAVKELLDALGVEQIVLGGLSMGGSVAAEFTALYPEMVKGLALMDTNINADNEAQAAGRLGMAEKADAGNGYAAVSGWPNTMLSSQASDELRASLDAALRALPNEGLAWEQRAMAGRADRAAAVTLVAGPVYLGRGSEDPTCSMEYLQGLASKARQPRIVEFTPGSHFAANEQPAQVAAFLQDLYAQATK